MKKLSTVFGLVCFVTIISFTIAEYDNLCNRFSDKVTFRAPGNCSAYVTCKNGTGTVNTCPTGQSYDKDSKKCVSTLSDPYCEIPCKNKNNVWVSDPVNCDGFYFCSSGTETHGNCPDGYHFDETQQMCIFSIDSECNDISDFCGILPSNVPFTDPNNCNKYFQCAKGKLKQTTCGSGLYYDVKSEKCISLYQVKCLNHPLPQNVCGKDGKPIRNKFVKDGVSCRGYYFCANKGAKIPDKHPTWNQCPEGLFFDQDKQACLKAVSVQCEHNRCEGRGNLLVIAEDWGCRYYYACKDGLVLEKRKCLKDMFFDEDKQACTLNETSYSVCDY